MKVQAYEKLEFYKNICKIRLMTSKIAERIRRNRIRLSEQMMDSARSAKQNIREGYRKDSAGEFGRSIKISAGSLGELEGDVDDCFEDRLIDEDEYNVLKDLLGKTKYQIDRYLDSLYKLARDGKWKTRFNSSPKRNR